MSIRVWLRRFRMTCLCSLAWSCLVDVLNVVLLCVCPRSLALVSRVLLGVAVVVDREPGGMLICFSR